MNTSLPQGKVPMSIQCGAGQLAPGVYALALVQCPALGLQDCLLVLDVPGNEVRLEAPCRCSMGARLSDMALQLSAAIASKHGQAPAGIPRH